MLVSKVETLSVPFPFWPTLTFLPGTSKIALDVFAGVASEYLLNVGRTIQFLSEKYGKKMSPEVGPHTPHNPPYLFRRSGNHPPHAI